MINTLKRVYLYLILIFLLATLQGMSQGIVSHNPDDQLKAKRLIDGLAKKHDKSKEKGSETVISLFPEPSSNNPDFLVRTMFFIPDDRWSTNTAELNAKFAKIRLRMNNLFKMLEIYFDKEFQAKGMTAKHPNFEKDIYGNFVVHFYHGAQRHNWYWGDNNANGTYGEPEDTDCSDYEVFALSVGEVYSQQQYDIGIELKDKVVLWFSDCQEYWQSVPTFTDQLPNWVAGAGFGSQSANGSLGAGGDSGRQLCPC